MHLAQWQDIENRFVEWLNDCSWTRLHAVTVVLAETPDKIRHSSSQAVRKDLNSLKTHRISDWSFPLSSLLSASTIPFQKWWEIITLCPLVRYPALYSPLDLGWMAGCKEDYCVPPVFWEFASLCKGPLIEMVKNPAASSLLINS